MTAPELELGDIFRLHGPAYLTRFGAALSREQKQALKAIAACRTAVLGGYVEHCDQCGYRKVSYCSCRNRHCPKCSARARAQWLWQRAAELLPVEYFHVVFTVPQLLAPLALQNQRLVYGVLFRAAAETLLQIAADPRHLGARLGFLAVLHRVGLNKRQKSSTGFRATSCLVEGFTTFGPPNFPLTQRPDFWETPPAPMKSFIRSSDKNPACRKRF